MDRGAWWATDHVVARSQTQLKRLDTHAGGRNGSHVTLEVRAGEVGLRGVCTGVSVRAIGEGDTTQARLVEKVNDRAQRKSMHCVGAKEE